MSVAIERLERVTDEVAAAVPRLVAQLSSSARPPDRAALERVVGHPANTVLVARGPDGIVGVLTLVVFPLLTGVRAWIEDVVVDESARGAGIGAALTREALRIAGEAAAHTVDLTSRPDRAAAHRLYRRLGFEPRATQVYRYAAAARS